MKDNKTTILIIICAVLGCLTIFFGVEYFTSEKCVECEICQNTQETQNNQSAEDAVGVKTITFEEYKKLISEKKDFFMYFSQTTCPSCIAFEPTLKSVFEEEKEVVYKLNINLMSNIEYNALKAMCGFDLKGTPTLTYYKDGSHVENMSGNRPAEQIKTLIDNNR